MHRQRNFMSRHNQEKQEGNVVATKLLCRSIPFEYSSRKALKKCCDTRHSCCDNNKTTSVELCRDKKLQSTTKLENKDGSYVATQFFNVATKQPIGPIFGNPQLQLRNTTHHLKIYK